MAAKPYEMSARTGGLILLQLLFDLSRPEARRTGCSTADERGLADPWGAHLRALGVDYRSEHQVQAIHSTDGLTGVSIVAHGQPSSDMSGRLLHGGATREELRLLAAPR